MVAEYQDKRSRIFLPMDFLFICVGKWLHKIVPISLILSHVVPQPIIQRLIVALGLLIGLWMIGRSGQLFHPQEVAHFCEELFNTFRYSIGN